MFPKFEVRILIIYITSSDIKNNHFLTEEEMAENFDACPYCGNTIMKGAMRCVACGKIVKTADEQADAIKTLTKTKKKFRVPGFFKLIAFLLAAGAAYHYFPDQINGILQSVIDYFGK